MSYVRPIDSELRLPTSEPLQVKRELIQFYGCIVFFSGTKTAVKESQVADIRTFKIKQHFFIGMISYKSINKAMRSTDRSSIRMIAYQDIISPVVRENKNAGSNQFLFLIQYPISRCLLPAI